MNLHEVKAGDRVQVIQDYLSRFVGRVGKVIYVSSTHNEIAVHFDDDGPSLPDYWFKATELESYYEINELQSPVV